METRGERGNPVLQIESSALRMLCGGRKTIDKENKRCFFFASQLDLNNKERLSPNIGPVFHVCSVVLFCVIPVLCCTGVRSERERNSLCLTIMRDQ